MLASVHTLSARLMRPAKRAQPSKTNASKRRTGTSFHYAAAARQAEYVLDYSRSGRKAGSMLSAISDTNFIANTWTSVSALSAGSTNAVRPPITWLR